MQKNNHIVLGKGEALAKENREYIIDKVVYSVYRVFDDSKTIKELLLQRISNENLLNIN